MDFFSLNVRNETLEKVIRPCHQLIGQLKKLSPRVAIWDGHKCPATVIEKKPILFLILTPFLFPLHLFIRRLESSKYTQYMNKEWYFWFEGDYIFILVVLPGYFTEW